MQPLIEGDASDFFVNYEVNEELGKGKFSVVNRCTLRRSKLSYAVKMVKTTQLNNKDNKFVKQEIDILRQLNHKNIVRLHEVYLDLSQTFLVLDFLSGGELFDDIIDRSHYTETDASICIQQVLEAVSHCHDSGIVHRDLKPENLLLASKSKNALIKLADFGIAVQLKGANKAWFGFAGTPGYLSPEVIQREDYGRGIDIWACGVILYILLCGYPPFSNEDQRDLFRSITECRYEFHPQEWDTVTPKAKELIENMLHINQNKRPSAEKLLTHPWIRERSETASNHNRQKTIGALRRFNAKRKLKGAVHSIMAINRLGFDTNEVKKEESSSLISNPPISIKNAHLCSTNANDDIAFPPDRRKEKLNNEIEKEILNLTQRLVNTDALSTSDMICDKSTIFQSGVPCLMLHGDKYYSAQNLKYSILQPTFHIISQDAVCIAYILVCSVQNDILVNLKSYKETRVWQKTGDGWICIHCHSSDT